MTGHVLVIDQGTTSTRAIVFDAGRRAGRRRRSRNSRRSSRGPAGSSTTPRRSGGRRCRPRARRSRSAGARRRRARRRSASPTSARRRWSGTARPAEPIHNAIVWQDRRTADACAALKAAGHEPLIAERTGLLLDPYFSATKIAWLLDNVAGRARRAPSAASSPSARSTRFLLWRLTGGARARHRRHQRLAHAALRHPSRAMGRRAAATVRRAARAAARGARLRRRIRRDARPSISARQSPIRGVAGDQQAALIGQACFAPGMVKSTYGTGCFLLLNTGDEAVASRHSLLTTIAYQSAGERTYALEGSIFVGRRGGAMAARRAWASIATAPETGELRGRGRSRRSASISCRPSPASARRIGTARRAARSSA